MGVAMMAFCIPDTRGQSIGPSILNTSGGYGTIAGNDYEWSVGELAMVNTYTSAAVTVTQGLLQPAYGSLGVAKTQPVVSGLRVFPNPSSAIVNVQYSSPGSGIMNYRVMDVTGQLLQTGSVKLVPGVNTQQVNISTFAEGNYMLEVECSVTGMAAQQMSYKIQKLN